MRLIAMQGYETNPRVSRNGKWIEFTGRQYGNADIFVMPVNGGDIKKITWHSSNDEMSSWSYGNDLEKTGVQLGIKVINTFEAKLNAKDPELDRAIKKILKQLK